MSPIETAAFTTQYPPALKAHTNTWVTEVSSRNEEYVKQPALPLMPWQSTDHLLYWQPCTCWPRCLAPKVNDLDVGGGSKVTTYEEASIPVQGQNTTAHYYESAFESFQQNNCRTLAKAYIKLVEPRKQVNYPYNGRKNIGGRTIQLDPNTTKPPWWPSQVSHREPDHLPKAGKGITIIFLH